MVVFVLSIHEALYAILAPPLPFFTFTYCHFFLSVYDIINDVLNNLGRIKQQNLK